jgi:uncharacterized membrane protein
MDTNRLFKYIKVLATLGVMLAVFLLWEQITQPVFRPCNINSFINCDAVISGPVAKTFGIPTPLYGLIGYLTILVAAIYKNKKLIFYMASFGLLFCLWIAYKELFQLKVICPVCIVCQLIMITVFSLSIVLLKRKSDSN